MTDLFSLLQHIKARPEMYIGGATPLRDLENLITGYELALENHQIAEAGLQFNQQFSSFLEATQAWSVNRGWARAFEAEFEKPQLLKMFFLQLQRFVQSQNTAQQSR